MSTTRVLGSLKLGYNPWADPTDGDEFGMRWTGAPWFEASVAGSGWRPYPAGHLIHDLEDLTDGAWTEPIAPFEIGTTNRGLVASHSSGLITLEAWPSSDLTGTDGDALAGLLIGARGNFDVRVRVNTFPADVGTRLSIGVRSGGNTNALHATASVVRTGASSYESRFIRRATEGGATAETVGGAVGANTYLRLRRVGTVFSAFTSPDGTTWTQVGVDATIGLVSTAYIVVGMSNAASIGTAKFDNVKLTGEFIVWKNQLLRLTFGAGLNVTEDGAADQLIVDATEIASMVKWNALQSPDGNQALTMVSNTSAWTWNATTGGNNLLTLQNGNNDTGTGAILAINTPGETNAKKPFRVVARGVHIFEMGAGGELVHNRTLTTTATVPSQAIHHNHVYTDASSHEVTGGRRGLKLIWNRAGSGGVGSGSYDSLVSLVPTINSNLPHELRGIDLQGPDVNTGVTLAQWRAIAVRARTGPGAVTTSYGITIESGVGYSGFGTLLPTAMVDITATASEKAFRIAANASPSAQIVEVLRGAENIFLINSTGTISIGTISSAAAGVDINTRASLIGTPTGLNLVHDYNGTQPLIAGLRVQVSDLGGTGRVRTEGIRLQYTHNTASVPTGPNSLFRGEAFISESGLPELRGIYITGPLVSATKNLGTWTALYIGAPTGSGSVSFTKGLIVEAGMRSGFGITDPLGMLHASATLTGTHPYGVYLEATQNSETQHGLYTVVTVTGGNGPSAHRINTNVTSATLSARSVFFSMGATHGGIAYQHLRVATTVGANASSLQDIVLQPIISSTMTLTDYWGLRIETKSGAGAITNPYGVAVSSAYKSGYGTLTPLATLEVVGDTLLGSDLAIGATGGFVWMPSGSANVTATPTSYHSGNAIPIYVQRTTKTIRAYIGGAWETIGGGSGGYTTIQDEGSALTARATLNFVGNVVAASDDSGNTRTNVTINAVTQTSGSGSEVQYRTGTYTLGAVTNSSVSGANVTLGGLLTVNADILSDAGDEGATWINPSGTSVGTYMYGFGAAPIVKFHRAPGTQGSPGPNISSGDTLGMLEFNGRLGGVFLNLANIYAIYDSSYAGGVIILNAPGLTITGQVNFPDGIRQTFNPNASNSGLNVGSHTADPSTPQNGDIYYDSTNNLFRFRQASGWMGVDNPAGANGEIQVRASATTFTSVTNSSVSGPDITIAGALRSVFTTTANKSALQGIVTYTNSSALGGVYANIFSTVDNATAASDSFKWGTYHVYTWGGSGSYTDHVAISRFNASINQNLATTLRTIYITGPSVASTKTLSAWEGIRIEGPPGPGTITTKRAIVVDAGAGDVVLNAGANLSTSAQTGFLFLPVMTDGPTGTPASITGARAVVIEEDTTNGHYRLHAYLNNTWKTLSMVVPGSSSELMARQDGSTLQALSGSSVSGANLTLGGSLTIAASQATLDVKSTSDGQSSYIALWRARATGGGNISNFDLLGSFAWLGQIGGAPVQIASIEVTYINTGSLMVMRPHTSGLGTIELAATQVALTGALSLPDDIRQTFNPGSTVSGLNVGSQSGAPSTPLNGDIYYSTSSNAFQFRQNGAWVTISGTYTTIQDEGSALTVRPTLNFIGNVVAAADDSGNTRTNITINAVTQTLGSGSEVQYRTGTYTLGAVTGSSVTGADVTFAGTLASVVSTAAFVIGLRGAVTYTNSSTLGGVYANIFSTVDNATAASDSYKWGTYFLYTWGGSGSYTDHIAISRFNASINQNLTTTLRTIYITAPSVASTKTLSAWEGIRIEGPPGPGTITTKHAMIIEDGAGRVVIGDTSASAKLHVKTASNSEIAARIEASSHTSGAMFFQVAQSGTFGVAFAILRDRSWYAEQSNGESFKFAVPVTTTINASNGSTTISAAMIPAGAMVLAVVAYVVTTFGNSNGLTSIKIGDGTVTDRFGAAIARTSGTQVGSSGTADGYSPRLYQSATNIVVTANGGTFDATGQIRITIWYLSATPPIQ